MSKTYRREPFTPNGFRKPKTKNERWQLSSLKADLQYMDYDISPVNRINRHIPTDWDDVRASSIHERKHQS